jgi:hypothetical protein
VTGAAFALLGQVQGHSIQKRPSLSRESSLAGGSSELFGCTLAGSLAIALSIERNTATAKQKRGRLRDFPS